MHNTCIFNKFDIIHLAKTIIYMLTLFSVFRCLIRNESTRSILFSKMILFRAIYINMSCKWNNKIHNILYSVALFD